MTSDSLESEVSTSSKADHIGGEDYFKSLYHGSHIGHQLPVAAKPNVVVVDVPELAADDDDLAPLQEILAREPEPDALSTEFDPEFLDEVGPALPKSFNLAAFVNKSETLQQLVQLGVDLSKCDKKKLVPPMLLQLNFEVDVKPRIQFLTSIGVPADRLGYLLTKNPFLLKEPLDDLQVRVNYLLSKKFSREAIARIASNAPFFLMFSTQRMDRRLGFFQKTFELTGDEVRHLVARLPKLPTFSLHTINMNTFAIKEEMGFSKEETKKLLLSFPKLFLTCE